MHYRGNEKTNSRQLIPVINAEAFFFHARVRTEAFRLAKPMQVLIIHDVS
jgi:hypothetical protein